MDMEERTIKDNPVLIKKDEYNKSNYLISSMYQSSLFENKILAISLSRVQVDSDAKKIFSITKAGEIKKMLNDNAGSFYAKLNKAASHMTGKSIGMSNPISQEFDYIAIITRATYRNSELTIYFNYDLLEYIYNIKSNYTKLQLSLILSFKNNYSYRLYELLKAHAYCNKNILHNDEIIYKVSFPLAELKFNLGLANIDDDNVMKILKNKKCPDFEKAIDAAQEKMYDRWCDFKNYVLDPAIKEINELSDLEVQYETSGKGKGGKIHQIVFYVQKHKTENEKKDKTVKNLSQEEKDEIIEEIIYRNLSYRIKIKDAVAIAEAASWDMEKINNAFAILKGTSGISNITGFIISAIKNGYQRNEQNTEQKKNMFNNFQQLSYASLDFENFEKMIVKN